MKIEVFTYQYQPFRMGGPLWRPIKVKADAVGPITLRQGMEIMVVSTPDGRTFYSELKSGALLGDNLAEIVKDADMADPQVVAGQIAESIADMARAVLLGPDQFWRLIKKE